MATHSSMLVWKIPWTEELSELQAMGWQRVGTQRSARVRTHTHTQTRQALFSSSERASSEDPNVSLGPFISDNFEAGQNP